MKENTTSLPLSKLKVLDLTSFVSGPYCAQILADLGADVIKVERVPDGDSYRKAGPHYVDGHSTLFLSLNRNKKSLALNLKSEEGRNLFLEKLVPASDVLLENFSPGTMDSLGLGFEACRARNPRLVYCSISGFGDKGPYRDKKGFDLIIQAVSGIMDLTGEEASGPVKVGMPITDYVAGLFAAVGVLSACYERDTSTGVGKKVSTSLFESSISLLSILACDYLASGEVPRRMGSASPSFAPYQAFRTKDSYLCVAGAGTEEIWKRFVRVLDTPWLLSDPRFATNSDRVKNQKELEAIVGARLAERDSAEWVKTFEAEGVPCGPVNSLAEVLSDPHTRALGMILDTPLTSKSRDRFYKGVRVPLKVDHNPELVLKNEAPPLLGEHTDEVLSSIGVGRAQAEQLRKRGVIL